MRKSKNRYFYHIFVSPGDAPGAITLNVVWMEREFDAYKLSRCTCHLTITVSEIKRDIGWKSSFFHTPLHSRPWLGDSRRNIATSLTFGIWKSRMVWLPDGENISKISLFVLTQLTNMKCEILRRITFHYRFKPCRFGDGLRRTRSRNMASFVVSQTNCTRRWMFM